MKKQLKKFCGLFAKNWLFIALLLVFFVSGIACMQKSVLWDEAVYIGVGKHIYSGGKAGIYEPFRPFVLPLLTGFFWSAGLEPVFAAKTFMLVVFLGFLVLLYAVAKTFFGRTQAVLAVLLTASSPLFFGSSTRVYTDILAGCFVISAILCLHARKNFLAGLLCACAFASRFPFGVVAAACFASLIFFRAEKRELLEFCSGFVIGMLVFFVVSFALSGKILAPVLNAFEHSTSQLYGVDGFWKNITYYPGVLLANSPALLLSIAGFCVVFAERKIGRGVFALLLLFLFLLCFFTIVPNKQERFAIFILPLTAVFAGVGAVRLSKTDKRARAIVGLIIAASLTYGIYLSAEKAILPEETALAAFYGKLEELPYRTILTTDPLPAALTNKKFIPYYFSVSDAERIYENEKKSVDAVVFTPSSFASRKKDELLEERTGLLFKKISSENVLVANTTYAGQGFYIFERTG